MSVAKLPTIAVMLIILCLALIVSASCLEPRIIGGTPTTIANHPYQVSIHYNGKLACGGSIIDRQWILTAAHCIYGYEWKLFRVRIASSYHDEGGKLISDIASLIIHKKYRNDNYDYDVALIKLSRSLILGPNVKPILLASFPVVPPSSMAIVAGWGKTLANGAISKILRSLKVPVIDDKVCRNIYVNYRNVTSNMLCAGDITSKKDTCQGDSGGALVYSNVQIGIVSWGTLQCARVGFPGVYTRVSAIRQWIHEQANV